MVGFRSAGALGIGALLLSACGGGSGKFDDLAGTAAWAPEWVQNVGGPGQAYGVGAEIFHDGSPVFVTTHDLGVVLARGTPQERTFAGTGESAAVVSCQQPGGTLVWSFEISGSSYVVPYGSAILSDDTCVLAGFYAGTASFGDALGAMVPSTPIGSETAFLARYSRQGALLWVRSFGGAGGLAEALSVANLPDGSIAVCGLYVGSMTLGSGEVNETTFVSSNLEAFVARYLVDGTLVWARSTSVVTGYASAWAVTAASDGSVMVAGSCAGQVTFGPSEPAAATLDSTAGTGDSWLARLDPMDGSLDWVRRIGGDSEDQVYGVTSGNDGLVRVSGYFAGTTEVDADGATPIELTSNGGSDLYVAAFDASGTAQWARSFGGTGDDVTTAVVGLPDGSVLLTGSYQGTLDFDGAGPIAPLHLTASTSGADAFVCRLEATGAPRWARCAGGAQDDTAIAIALDPATDSLFVAGSFGGTAVMFDKLELRTLTAVGAPDAFFARLRLSNNPFATAQTRLTR